MRKNILNLIHFLQIGEIICLGKFDGHQFHSFFEDLDADSLDIVELILTFEEAFKVDISDEAAAEMSSVQDVFNFATKIS